MDKAFEELIGLQLHLHDSGVPTEVEQTFSREMQPLWARHGELMERYPSLADKLVEQEFEQSQKAKVPEKWTERLLKKIREKSENPTVKRTH
jgi:translation initiation factor 2 alpha subunit (eIF-2alpha)